MLTFVICSQHSTLRAIYSTKKEKKKKERFEIKNQNFHPKKLEKERQVKSKISRRKEIIKI